MFECKDCGGDLILPFDVQNDEIIGCEDCGLDYVVEIDEPGLVHLLELAIEGEDWGE
jgi:hypothetical protein